MIKTTVGLRSVDGFLFLGKAIGIKKGGKKDLGILYSEKVCNASAVYTKNKVKGAPLHVTKKHLEDGKAQCIVVNSGNSNVATGEKGIKDAEKMVKLTSDEFGIKAEDVLVASTGVIGKKLPMELIEKGIKGSKSELMETHGGFAEAILTTDLATKKACGAGDNFNIVGIAKGSGMIHPNMATMLAFIVTDADIDSHNLQKYLSDSVGKSFNMVSVDMDTSTSDMAIVMANGNAGKVDEGEFQEALDNVCTELAKMIAKDGEGATKLIISKVSGAKTEEDAKKLAKAVVNSNLVKCAIFGADPNWGRIMCALGNSGAESFEQEKIKITLNNELIVERGKETIDFDADKISKIIKENDEIIISIGIGIGESSAESYGCDMSYDYVKINAEYTT